MPLFQGQEPCSGLKNFDASGWFFNSAPQPSTSQIYCGHRTLIMKKCKSQIIIHKVHSLMCRCFLMGTMGDQTPGVWLFVTPWTVACLCTWGFSKQEYWSGLPFPPPGDFPNPGIKPRSPVLQAASLPSEPQGSPWGKTGGQETYILPHVLNTNTCFQPSFGP